MKKLFILTTLFLTLLSATVLGYENNYFSANLLNYTPELTEYNSTVFWDNAESSSNIEIAVQSTSLGTNVFYYDIYNKSTLNNYEKELIKIFQENVSSNAVTTESSIADFGKYRAFSYLFTSEIIESFNYFSWYYIILSDNYMYEIGINSYNENYLKTDNIQNFINSFKIKDTTNLCTIPNIAENLNVSSDTNWQSSYANYTIKDWIINFLFTAAIYLFIPIIIKFVFKKSFETGKAFGISLLHFVLIKLLLCFLLEIEFTTSGWIYLFIGQAILTKKKDTYDNFENSSSEDIIKNEKEISEEVLNILSDKDRIKNILDGNEEIDESLFLGIENPYNNKIIENSEDIKEYLSSFYSETNNINT